MRKRRVSALTLRALHSRKKAPQPGFIEFCDPTLTDTAPAGGNWVHEIKADGYRAQAHLSGNKVLVYSRRGYDWTEQFRWIAEGCRALNRTAILDGEAVVLGQKGVADYQELRRALGRNSINRLNYQVFDLLYLDGFDLRRTPFMERKALLRELLKEAPEQIKLVDFIEADADTVFTHACRLGVEGIVSKRKDSSYRSGRQEGWLKRKCTKSDDFPIVAFVEKLGARPRRIASLYVGR